MSYIVIARKYRPMFFKDVVGQEHITRTLSNAIKTNHIGQAFLFTGTRGVGKTTTARILAKALNCEKGLNPEPCNECETCKSITEGQHVDVMEIDGASNRGIDDIRELRSAIKFKPMISRFKIYIIDEVHMVTTEAFNALLKTLEEPPPHAIFIFATTDLHKVPETILSRCMLFQFRKISAKEITDALTGILKNEKIKFEPEAISEIAKLGDGSLRDSESLLDQTLAFENEFLKLSDVREVLGITPQDALASLTNAIFTVDKIKTFEIIHSIIDSGYDLSQFIKDYIQYQRDILFYKNFKNASIDDRIKNSVELLSSNKIIRIIELLLGFLKDLKFTTYPAISIELAFFKILQIIEQMDIDELNAHIKKMELLISSKNYNLLEIQDDNSFDKEKKNIDRNDELTIIKNLCNDFAASFEAPLSGYLGRLKIREIRSDEIIFEISGLYYDSVADKKILEKINVFFNDNNISKKVIIEKENASKSGVKKNDNKNEGDALPDSVKNALNIFGGSLIDIKTVKS